MMNDSQSPQQVTHADPPTLPDALSTHRLDPSIPSPSARTSFTRVDTMANEDDREGNQAQEQQNQIGMPAHTGDEVQQETEPEVPHTPEVALTFLLVSGKRKSMSFDPETTIGRTKELVWNAWPKEWQDERPPAPSYLRILYLGKILQDEDTLSKVGFPISIPSSPAGQANTSATTPPLPTIVHLSIRSSPPAGGKDTPKKKSLRISTSTDGSDEVQGSCCCVVC